MINPAAILIKGQCRGCDADIEFLVIPLCERCLKLLHSWDDLTNIRELVKSSMREG